jgi:hypothetical protein
VSGPAPWDKPAPFTFDEQQIDDRPAEMLASYDEMIPMVKRRVAAATAAQAAASDPDDALAPVLNDVTKPAPPVWPESPVPAEPAAPRTPSAPRAPLGKILGPTPPEGLFDAPEPPAPPEPPASAATEPQPDHEPVPALEPAPAPVPVAEMQHPQMFSTSPNMQQQPLVLRIELAIVDESNKLRPADRARRVGPWSDDDGDADAVTPRHPEFEPRNHVAPAAPEAAAVEEVTPALPEVGQIVPDVTDEPAPWASDSAADLPWELPPLEPVTPEPAVTRWTPVQHQPYQPPVQEPIHAAPPPEPEPAPIPEPHPDTAWALTTPPTDPLAYLPAATFAPAQPAPAPAPAPVPVQEFPVAQSVVVPAPQLQPQPSPAPVQSAPARPAANADQSDLWFLASEPEVVDAEPASAEKVAGQPSPLLTMGLTVAMAVVVIVLVLVFITLLTGLLGAH